MTRSGLDQSRDLTRSDAKRIGLVRKARNLWWIFETVVTPADPTIGKKHPVCTFTYSRFGAPVADYVRLSEMNQT